MRSLGLSPWGPLASLLVECLLLEDCCAALELFNHDAIVRITKSSYGQFGVATDSRTFLAALS
jgi:nicotinamidase-related amidase